MLLSCFGHDKAKNNFEIILLSLSCELLDFAVCMQWLVFGLYWSGNEGLVCLKNLVCLGTTQRELEGWIYSPQPLNSIGREVRA